MTPLTNPSHLGHDFVTMLEGASHVGALTPLERDVFLSLDDASITRAALSLAARELLLSAWAAYLVERRDEITSSRARTPREFAAALYLSLDLHMPLVQGARVTREELLAMFALDASDYDTIAELARPIFSYLSTLSPDVLRAITRELHIHQRARHHAAHARQIHRLAEAFWASEPKRGEQGEAALDALPREPRILRATIIAHTQENHGDDVPEPSYFFCIEDAQSGAPRVMLPWFGPLDEATRQTSLRRAVLEAIWAPHHGDPFVPVAIVAPTSQDIGPLTEALGLPEVVILNPERMPKAST